MLSEKEVARFQADGYLKGSKILSDEQVETLRDELQRVLRDKDKTDVPQPALLRDIGSASGAVWQIVNIWEASKPFRSLVSHPIITEEIAQLTAAKTLRIWHDQIQYKPASTGGVNMWHQDAPYWPVLAPMTEVSAWVALDDVDPENGCMSMVPGSHKWGDNISVLHKLKDFDSMPAEFQGRPIEVRPCPVRRGEVHYHHALTWHGSPANRSTRPRRAIALHYMTEQTRYVAGGNHALKSRITVADGEFMSGDTFPIVWDRQTVPA